MKSHPADSLAAAGSGLDALLRDCLRLATAARSYARLPRRLGGGGKSFRGISFAKCGWANQRNAHGTFFFLRIREDLFDVLGYAKDQLVVTVTVTPDSVGAPNVYRSPLPSSPE